jgi:uncharacterized protein (DUF2237 family)
MSGHPSGASGISQRNVVGAPLQECSFDPLTGFFRDGCCNTSEADTGSHVVCVAVTAEFLAFSRDAGNDLTTPNAAFGFPGLVPGNRWCVCAARWQEALEAGVAPPVVLESTNEAVLAVIRLDDLIEHRLFD